MNTPVKSLVSKFNPSVRKLAERAAGLAVGSSHYEVDVEHLLLAACEQPATDMVQILQRCGGEIAELQRELGDAMREFRTGNSRTPVFSIHLLKLFEQAWLVASLDERGSAIRSGHLLLALVGEPALAQLAARNASTLRKVRPDDLRCRFDELTQGSEEAPPTSAVNKADAAGSDRAVEPERLAGPGLARFTMNLTQRAREGALDPVIGRDAEIRQLIDILMRRRQNNPILTGEAGVGKTAVVEGLALRIANGDVPSALQGIELHILDMGLLQAGASVKGEFENRLRSVIDEVRTNPVPIILFIDEAHTIIGAGGQAGQNDAANLLKPALARGELRTIAATTWSEYKKYFEKDAALARRFQVVRVEEPEEPVASAMVRALVPFMERHFGVRVRDEAVTEAVRLSHRYISGRQLPDKAVSLLDTACAKVALAHSGTPAAVEDEERALERLLAEEQALARESKELSSGRRRKELSDEIAATRERLVLLRGRHEREKGLVDRVRALRRHRLEENDVLEVSGEPCQEIDASSEPDTLIAELRALQGESPMLPLEVDGNVIAEVVAAWTGIPVGKMLKDEISTVLRLKPLLEERILGQSHALEAVAQRVRTARALLEDPNKPKAVFLFVGPSGVGKTETALALADVLYGGERKLLALNMSEYQEAHSVSGLKGSPPGYVGYGEGGVLTEGVRRNPHCVILLDEVEKAHPDVLELFFQVFDKGVLDDAEGREIDFRNTLIILTSNVGANEIEDACRDIEDGERPDVATLEAMLRPALNAAFKPAFLARTKVIPYYPISDDALAEIIRLKLRRVGERVAANHRADFLWDERIVNAIFARCAGTDSGARNIDHVLNGSLLPDIAGNALERMATGTPIGSIKVTAGKRGEFRYSIQ